MSKLDDMPKEVGVKLPSTIPYHFIQSDKDEHSLTYTDCDLDYPKIVEVLESTNGTFYVKMGVWGADDYGLDEWVFGKLHGPYGTIKEVIRAMNESDNYDY